MTVKQPFEITKPKLSDKELWLFMLQVQTWSLPQQLVPVSHRHTKAHTAHSLCIQSCSLLPRNRSLDITFPSALLISTRWSLWPAASWHWHCWCCTIPMIQENHSPFPWHSETLRIGYLLCKIEKTNTCLNTSFLLEVDLDHCGGWDRLILGCVVRLLFYHMEM